MHRQHVHPLVRSIVAPGGRFLPSRAHGVEQATSELVEAANVPTWWTPWLTVAPDAYGPRQSSGPLRGLPTRQGIGTAFVTPAAGWNLSGVATGWSNAGAPTPARQPTTALAIGRGWAPFAGGAAPTPSLPEPARMVAPMLR